ncbi:N-acetyltransferase [Hwanghaeella grinnelliae]|uniref:N-acetyltransferase n=1 Tax=Hwanghaeella grinnelliae TaxID=2500179 RepID=A0A3S2Y1S6_9PROT|nr:GNAT family N-acetyltransferase [Hwanghaeella grinnelliae]RVU35243.1 N-acetyltransferase [Hwanghaeella grinnelliae]
MARSVRVKSFELVAQDIADVDVNLLHALSIGVGWPHRPADWEILRRVGKGIVAVDGIGRVFGSAMWYPYGPDFAVIGLVITTPRAQAQGTGRWLMEQVLANCKGRDLSLNATKAAFPLYVSLGFKREATVNLLQGRIADFPETAAPEGTIGTLSVEKAAEILPLDFQAFGADRGKMLTVLSEQASLCAMWRDGEMVGYAMCREFGRGRVIGPIVARNDTDAIALTSWHLRKLRGQFVRIDTREDDGPFAKFLDQFSLTQGEAVSTMSKGRKFLNRRESAPWIYGLAGHALG